MKLIDKIIKILINFKYKREPFDVWSWEIDGIHDINILSAEYYDDHYRYGTRVKYYGVSMQTVCDDCVLDKIRAEIEQTTSRYCLSKERFAMGQVEWSDRLIKESEVLEIIDKYITKSENKEQEE